MPHHDYTIFYMAAIDLQAVLEPHEFYVTQARERLLSRFSDIAQEADEAERLYLERAGKNFDPERDDDAGVYERAYDAGIAQWIALKQMHNTITLALTAGMFHLFDKTLREKVVWEFSHWTDREIMGPLIWDLGFPRLIQLLEWAGIDIKSKTFFSKLDRCRMVVNVYKHGDGDAHRDLSRHCPEYYPEHLSSDRTESFNTHYEFLTVSESQFGEFADAIADFWRNLPEYTMLSQMRDTPDWLESEIKKYRKKHDKKNKLTKTDD
ncbi:hypothetical protein SMY46_003879 [Cronobacter turicensis]|nr:hypothetical protein [Cronobacter turicensis]ELZ8935162.1 hypothetical protein [Cronobacter dublinensis]EMA8648553.1 hypothetical protein [Cronobacter turicensis]